MQNKLQELTDKLYNEGLSKGKKEAEDLKAAAVKESDRIIADARKEAGRIIADARKEAEELRTRVGNDIRMASSQAISAVKQQIESIIISKAISSDIKKNLETIVHWYHTWRDESVRLYKEIGDNIDDHNTFDRPDLVTPSKFEGAKWNKGTLKVKLPAKSIVVLELK